MLYSCVVLVGTYSMLYSRVVLVGTYAVNVLPETAVHHGRYTSPTDRGFLLCAHMEYSSIF
jgi:hypothetical protein